VLIGDLRAVGGHILDPHAVRLEAQHRVPARHRRVVQLDDARIITADGGLGAGAEHQAFEHFALEVLDQHLDAAGVGGERHRAEAGQGRHQSTCLPWPAKPGIFFAG
jgi:hypothetical protein